MARTINGQRWKVGGLAAILLFTLALFFLARNFSTLPGDERIILWMEGLQSGWLNILALAVTKVGSTPIAEILLIGAGSLLYLNRRRVDALIVTLTVVPLASVAFLKMVIDRARPDFFIVGSQPDSMSFPSGHAAFAILFGGILVVVVGDLIKSRRIRRSLQIFLGLLILGVGISRVYLGVHWPSDVIGGYLFGGMALLGLVWLRSRVPAILGGLKKTVSQPTAPVLRDNQAR